MEGSNLHVKTSARKACRRNRFILAIVLVVTLSTIQSASAEAVQKVSLEEVPYHFKIQRQGYAFELSLNPGLLRQIEGYLDSTESMVEESELVYNTIALFNVDGKNESYECGYILYEDYNRSVVPKQIYGTNVGHHAQLVSNGFMNRIRNQLRVVDGEFQFGGNNVIMNKILRNHIYESIGLEINAGDTITISLARNDITPIFGFTTLEWYNRTDFPNLRIAAIVERIPTQRLTNSTFNEVTLGDGLYISHEIVNQIDPNFLLEIESGISQENPQGPLFRSIELVFPRLFVRLNKAVIAESNPPNLEEELHALENRIRVQGQGGLMISISWLVDPALLTIDSQSSGIVGFTIGLLLIAKAGLLAHRKMQKYLHQSE